MAYDPEKHHRRSIRLRGYDYSQPGAYFVTIVTHNRACLFGDVVNGEMQLNQYGEIVQHAWFDLPRHYPHIRLDAFCVMPNHIHAIIIIVGDNDDDHEHAPDVPDVPDVPVGAGLRPAPTGAASADAGAASADAGAAGTDAGAASADAGAASADAGVACVGGGMAPADAEAAGADARAACVGGGAASADAGAAPTDAGTAGADAGAACVGGGVPPADAGAAGVEGGAMSAEGGAAPADNRAAAPRHPLSEIVRALKSFSARRINGIRQTPGVPVWQRNYYDRIIRNPMEYNWARRYIETNPANWMNDSHNLRKRP
ncbi:MAG: transposase [Roseiflexaceae bacterium]|nr:transposase [Roseiflexaceae bacterium]